MRMSYGCKSEVTMFAAGAGLDKTPGYTEITDNSKCTQYSSADCQKY